MKKIARDTFSENSKGSNLPSIKIKKTRIEDRINIIDLIIFSKFETSKSEIRRLLKGRAIKINNKIVEDEKFLINYDLFEDNYFKLSIGKKRHLKIELS